MDSLHSLIWFSPYGMATQLYALLSQMYHINPLVILGPYNESPAYGDTNKIGKGRSVYSRGAVGRSVPW